MSPIPDQAEPEPGLENLALSDNGFLFDTRTGHTFSLSRTGTFLLRALIGGTPQEALPEQLVATYEVDLGSAERDTREFLFRLRDLGLLSAPGADATGGA